MALWLKLPALFSGLAGLMNGVKQAWDLGLARMIWIVLMQLIDAHRV